MPYPLLTRVREVTRLARRLAMTRALAAALTVMLAAALLLGGLDYLIRVRDVGTRVLMTVAWCIAGGVGVWYWLLPVRRVSWSDQDIARMIERRFPAFADRLSSALAFLHQSEEDVSAGSKTLMRNVITETNTALEEIDLRDAIDLRATRKTLLVFAAVVATCAVLATTHASLTWQAARRLAMPLREDPWPRVHHLRFVEPPTRIARGGDLRLTLIDEGGELPEEVVVALWHDDQDERDADLVVMQRTDDVMALQRNNVMRSFRYRATGGDDQHMPWTRLDVVEPPHLIRGKIELTPPTYTGWPPRTHHEPPRSLRVLEGTVIGISGRADRPLQAVTLRLRQAEHDRLFYAEILEADTFRVPAAGDEPWIAEESGEYSLELVDREGTETVDGDRWAVRVLADRPPSLSLLEPSAGDLVTPQAVVSIRCRAEDDLALRYVELRYLRTDQSDRGEQVVVLREAPAARLATETPLSLPPPAEVHDITYRWQLQPLSLQPGAALSFHLVAEDYKPQANQTMARRLLVVTEPELIDRAGRRQSLVLSRLQQRLGLQRQAQAQVDGVRIHLQETQSVGKATLDRLQAAVMAQRQVNSALQGDDAEILTELRRLRGMLDQSRVGDVDVRQKVERTLDVVEQLGAQHLEPALRQSTSARQSLQAAREQGKSPAAVPEDVPAALDQVSEHQRAAVEAIEVLLDEMSAWDNYRRFAQELGDLMRQQQDVSEATQEAALETLTLRRDQLDGAQRAALRGVASRQSDLARRMDRTLRNLAKAAHELASTDTGAAALVGDALDIAHERAISGLMRQTSQLIEQNRLGLAMEQELVTEQALEDMLDGLARQGDVSPQEKLERFGELDRKLQDLQNRQADMTQEFEQARRQSDPRQRERLLQRLTRRQAQIARELPKIQRQLERLQASSAATRTRAAADSTERAAQAAQQGQAGEARQQSESAEAQLQAARESLQQARQRAESALAEEQGLRLPQMIEALILQQENVVAEVERLERIRTLRGELTMAQKTSIALAAEAQRAVGQEAALIVRQVSQLPSFVFALESLGEIMDEVADALDRQDTSAMTHSRAREALVQLARIREALQPDQDTSQQEQPSTPEGQGGQPSAGPRDIELRMAQLKLLRGMQVAINEETRQLSRLRLEDAAQRRIAQERLQRLADQQGRLAEIVLELVTRQTTDDELPRSGPVDLDAGRPLLDALDQELERDLIQ